MMRGESSGEGLRLATVGAVFAGLGFLLAPSGPVQAGAVLAAVMLVGWIFRVSGSVPGAAEGFALAEPDPHDPPAELVDEPEPDLAPDPIPTRLERFCTTVPRGAGLTATVCGLCGDTGVLDTVGKAKTVDGMPCGVRAACVCPAGGRS